jgi:hypothetical protein
MNCLQKIMLTIVHHPPEAWLAERCYLLTWLHPTIQSPISCSRPCGCLVLICLVYGQVYLFWKLDENGGPRTWLALHCHKMCRHPCWKSCPIQDTLCSTNKAKIIKNSTILTEASLSSWMRNSTISKLCEHKQQEEAIYLHNTGNKGTTVECPHVFWYRNIPGPVNSNFT